MNGPGDELFPGSRLAENQDGGIGRRHFIDGFADAPDRFGIAQHFIGFADIGDALPQQDVFRLQPVGQSLDLRVRERI